MSHSGRGFWDTLSVTGLSRKARPTLDADSGMHFPRRRWLPAVVVLGFIARIELQHAAAVFAHGELGALQAATLARGQLGRVDLITIGLIGKKIGMTQIFDEAGNVVPVTVVEAGPCTVTQIKTMENDGYEAIQVGFGDVKVSRVNKPMKGHFDKADVAPKKTLKEFRLDSIDGIEVGNILKADTFEVGEVVDVKGTSKGHGTAGAIKRWNFSRLRMTHGTGPNHRHAGSLGACSSPSRVFKGKKMAGHYGHETVTVQNLKIAKVDAENNLIAIKGAIPGPKGGIVVIADAVKA